MRTPPATVTGGDTSLSTWREYKDRGRDEFQSENYSAALSAYRSALTYPTIPDSERQILLSNIVACRLQIGGAAQASAAIEEARQCVALNDRWAKGHVRLAAAYIALGGHSNDACRSLQTALNIDPRNAAARTMLMKELRRDRVARTGEGGVGEDNGGGGGRPEPSAPPMPPVAEDIDPSTGRPYTSSGSGASGQPPSSSSSPPPRQDYSNPNNRPPPRQQHNMNIDDSPTLSERFQFYLARTTTWYYNLSDDGRTLIKVLLGLTVLYVAMGGRFGLDTVLGGGADDNKGHYDYGNAYDRYYGRGPAGGAGTGGSGGDGGGASSYTAGGTGGYGSGGGGSSSYSTHGRRDTYESNSRGGSYHVPNLFDGSPLSILVLVVFGYACHRFGINPFHALWMLNMFTGNRGRGGRGMNRMGGMHGMGMGMMGMGYGMMNGGMRRRRGG